MRVPWVLLLSNSDLSRALSQTSASPVNPSLTLPIKLNLDSNSQCLISGGISAGEWLAEECLHGCAWVGACGRHWVPRPYPVTLPISTHGGLTASVHLKLCLWTLRLLVPARPQV